MTTSELTTVMAVTTATVPVWVALAAAAVVVLLLVALLLLRARARRRVAAAESGALELRQRLDALEARLAAVQAPAAGERTLRDADGRSYVITSLGEQGASAPEARTPAEAVRVPVPAFADTVVRETVVYTASFVQGVRRALSPEVRNRIRFEMRRELKRTRKARKVEVREALREYRARHRADVPADSGPAAAPLRPTEREEMSA